MIQVVTNPSKGVNLSFANFFNSEKPTLKVSVFRIIIFFLIASPTFIQAQNCSVNANVDASYCANVPIQLAGTVSSAVAGYAPPMTLTQVGGSSVVISNPNITNPSIIGAAPNQTYTFRLTIRCEDNESVFDEVKITVKPISLAMAGADGAYCPGTYSVTGNTPIYSGETVTWQIIGGNNAGLSISNPTSPTTPIVLPQTSAGSSTLRYTITNSNSCQTFDDLIITNRGGVQTGNAGSDQNIPSNVAFYSVSTCVNLNGTFEGNGTGGQTTTWSQVSGPTIGSFNNANIANPQVCNLKEGTYVFRLTATGPCATGFDEVTVIIPAPSQSITGVAAMPDVSFCDGRTSVVLNGTPPSYTGETVQWTIVTNGGGSPVIASPTSPNTTVTGLLSGVYYQFRYTITNAVTGCSTTGTVQVYNQTPPSINVGADQILACGTTTTTIPYTQSGGLFTQYQIISGPTGVMASPAGASNSPQAIFGLTVSGDYIIRFTRNSSPGSTCQTATDDIKIMVSLTASASNAGTDQSLACGVTTTNLAGNTFSPSLGIGRWAQISGPSLATISNVFANNTPITMAGPGDYTFRWTIGNGSNCPKNFDDVLVTIRTPPTANAGVDQIPVCYNTAVQLKASIPALKQVGTWSVVGQVPTGTAPTFSSINNPLTKIQGLNPNTTYKLLWTISSIPVGPGNCTASSDTVVIGTNTSVGPGDANAGVDICVPSGNTTVTFAATAPVTLNTGSWTNVSKPTGSATPGFSLNANQANTQATGLQAGIYKFVWTITDGVCTSNDTLQVTVNSAVPVASAGTNQTLCGTSTTLAGNGAGVGVGTWTEISGPSQASVVDVNNPATVVNSLVPGDYVFRWTITNGSCGSPTFANVTVKVSESTSLANIAATSIQVCPTETSTTLTADAINSTSQGVWSVVGNAPSAVSFSSPTNPVITVSGLLQGDYKFRWTVSGGVNCPTTINDIDVFVQEASDAKPDLNVCLSNSVLLTGNGSSGVWANVSGPNTPTLTPTSSPSNAVNVAGLVSGQYVFSYTIIKNPNATSCPNPTADQVTVNVSAAGSTPNAGADKQFCEGTAISLNTGDVTPNPVPGGQSGLWTILSQPMGSSNATLTNATSPSATLNIGSISKYGLYLLKWTITNGSCVIGDEVRIENFQTPTVANAGVDKTVCPPTVKMTGNVPTVGQGFWTLVSKTPASLPTPTIQNPQVATTDITGIDASGSYVFRWTTSNGPYTVSFDDVTVNVPDPAPTTANAGMDQTICNGTAANINANTPTIGTVAWSATPDSPYSVFSPASGTSPVTTALSLSPGIYKFIWTITSGICISRDTMIINNLAAPSTSNAGVDQIVCQFSPVNLNASVPTAGTGTWSVVSKPAANPSPTFISPNSPTSQVVGTDLGQYVFRWTVTTGIGSANDCQTSIDDVTVNIVAAPTPASAGQSQTICEGSTLTLAGNTPIVGTGTWSKLAGPSGSPEIITNVNSPTTTVTGLMAGTYKFRWTIGASGNCTSFDETIITVRPKPTLSSATPSYVGGAGTGVITITGSTNPTGGTLNYALNAGAFKASNNFNNVANGAYTITIKDVATGCLNSTTANVSCSDNPVIGVAKSATNPTLVMPGVYDVPYTVTVKNLGNTALSNVQVVDNLNTTFPSPITYTITSKLTTLPLTINSSFDGNTNQNLLTAGSSTLAIGGVQTIIFTVRVDLNGSIQTLFNNSATAGATNPSGSISSIADVSNNGGTSAIDPNGNGNPRDFGEDVPTPVTITNGNIGVSKTVGTPIKVSDGVYDVPYTVVVKNIGNVTLTGVQATDDLTTTYPTPTTFTISQTPQTLALFAPEPTFNGNSVKNLLLVNGANPSTLTAGQSRIINFTVRVTLNGSTQTIFNNQVTATGINPSSVTVTDLSNNGTDTAIDPNSNGFAGDNGENTPTPVVIANPIIGVAKSVVGTPTLQEDGTYNVVYQVITRNVGNVNLNNVQVTENLTTTFPSPITYTVVSKTGAADLNAGFLGTSSAQNLLTGSGTLVANTSNTYTFTVNIKLNGYIGSNTFLNTVNASGTGTSGGSTSDVSNNGTDPTPAGSTPTPVAIQNQADLSLTKTVSNVTPNVGDNVIYTITVNNAGPSTATNVEVQDLLPAGLNFVSSTDFINTAGTLTNVALFTVAVGTPKVLTFMAKVMGNQPINDKAEISKSDQFDPDSQPNTGTTDGQDDTGNVTITPKLSDLSLTKTVSNTDPNVNSNVTYTINVTNAGSDIATNVEVKDVLPVGLQFVSSADVVNTFGILTGTTSAIAVGGIKSFTFIAKVLTSSPILNKAEISKSDQFDPDSPHGNGTNKGEDDEASVMINGKQADLSLRKTVSNKKPNVGDELVYTLTVRNAGPDEATNVQVQDYLPAGLEFKESFDFVQQSVLRNLLPISVIAPNDSVSLTFVGVVNRFAKSCILTNKAEIFKANEFDPDSKVGNGIAKIEDDMDSVTVCIQSADLSLKKKVDRYKVEVGETVNYSIIVKDAGPLTATNVKVQDILPSGLKFISSDKDIVNNKGKLTLSVDSIKAGESATWTFKSQLTTAAATDNKLPITNNAQIIETDQFDPDSTPDNGTENGEDDESSATINAGTADLSIRKDVNPWITNVGQNVTYTITVGNEGINTATNVQVRDILPEGLKFISSNDFDYHETTRALIGKIDLVKINQNRKITFIAEILKSESGQAKAMINKTKIIKSDQFDPDSSPNSGTEDGEDDTDSVTVNGRGADLSLEKFVSNDKPNVGGEVIFTLRVRNSGPEKARNTIIKDFLPSGLALLSNTITSVGDFSLSSDGLISRVIPNIQPNTFVDLTFKAKVLQGGLITNKSEIFDTRQYDPDYQANTGTEDGQDNVGVATLVGQEADLSLNKIVNHTDVTVGDTLSYTVQVNNAGPSVATNVEIADILPGGLVLVKSNNGTLNGNILTFKVPNIDKNGSAVFEYKVLVTKEGSLVNKAQVTKSDQPDPDSTPNNGKWDGIEDDEASIVVLARLPCDNIAPSIIASKINISCQDSTLLTALGCAGIANWSDGQKGNTITIRPTADVTMTATCVYSSTCMSDVSKAVKITVTNPTAPVISVNKSQICGSDSVNLSATGCVETTIWSNGRIGNSITEKITATSSFTAVCKVGACNSPLSNEVIIKAAVEKPLVICGKERLCLGDTEVLKAIGCEAGTVTWSDGQIGQSIVVKPTRTQYQFTATCEVGTCKSEPSAPAYFIVTDCGKDSIRIVQKPMLALFKEAQIPVLVEGKTYDITYNFKLINVGNADFEQIQLLDNLDAVFTNKGAKILKIKELKADTGLVVNTNYDGRLNNQLLIDTQSHLFSGKIKSVQFTVSVDFTDAKVDTFYNSANAIAKAGKIVVQDVSNDGFDINPDGDNDPTNDSKPTLIRVLSVKKPTDEPKEIFIPEGFSPNGDGMNDLFIILLNDKTLTINLQIYNRWGGLVYASEDYQNNWDGTANQGINPTDMKGLPDGTYYYMVRLSNGKDFIRSMTLMR